MGWKDGLSEVIVYAGTPPVIIKAATPPVVLLIVWDAGVTVSLALTFTSIVPTTTPLEDAVTAHLPFAGGTDGALKLALATPLTVVEEEGIVPQVAVKFTIVPLGTRFPILFFTITVITEVSSATMVFGVEVIEDFVGSILPIINVITPKVILLEDTATLHMPSGGAVKGAV